MAGISFYRYVNSRPIRFGDPLGLFDFPPMVNPDDYYEPTWTIPFIDPEIDVWTKNPEECDGWLCMLIAAHQHAKMIVLGPTVMGLASDKISKHIKDKYKGFFNPKCPDDDGIAAQYFEFDENVDFRRDGDGTRVYGAILGLNDPFSLDLVLGNARVICHGALYREVDCCNCTADLRFGADCQIFDTFDFAPGKNRSPVYNRLASLWLFLYGHKLSTPGVFGETQVKDSWSDTPTGCSS